MEARRHRPFVLINMAITADGKIASANRAIETFSSDRDQLHLLDLRATADAVLCGAKTGNSSGVTLGVGGARFRRLRLSRGLAETHLRVLVSGQARLHEDAEVFRNPSPAVIVFVARTAPIRRVRRLRKVASGVIAMGERRVDLAAALRWLWRFRGVKRLVCEGGGELNDAMFRAGLVDEVHLTLCPKLLGGREAPTIADGMGVPALAMATRLELIRTRRAGDELFLTYRVSRRAAVRGPRRNARAS
jgi:riboflavin-specific deaminase-like protein